MYLVVILMFLVAGMLVGGAWTAYKQGAKFWTAIAAILALAASATAIAWMIGEM
ncbi:MAG: hypothetical protein ACTIA3_00815 [Corynebacterium casei]|uniref:Uncharacterized protein n=1 Tax=Corynebacterium casei UCMA 3821 TaxID=1110505 RepID=G7HV72_9CORY|nr:hypothetical protein [Corynebacterium casei]MDN5706773.1 hypothetical protein [Corynebacterium casei]MDN5729575.1 hypothetical protein [Corynebacterium casei]MDN5740525.1 hypothetical protein [Corynebacterium casei]MDN5799671.1 hypothetical protein [Corynebacterium casei]MDN5826272.1 hypothetical protein [Corynebacterium casei]